MELNTARILVRDLDAARSFYRDELGLALRAHSPEFGYCVFESGAARLVVEAVPTEAPADEQVLVGRFTGLSFAVENVAAAYQRLLSLEVPFSGAPEAQAWGGVLATFKDPAGERATARSAECWLAVRCNGPCRCPPAPRESEWT